MVEENKEKEREKKKKKKKNGKQENDTDEIIGLGRTHNHDRLGCNFRVRRTKKDDIQLGEHAPREQTRTLAHGQRDWEQTKVQMAPFSSIQTVPPHGREEKETEDMLCV